MSLTNGFSSASGLDTDIRQMPGFQGNDGLAELKVAQPKPRNMTDEDEESLKELCLQNGLNYSKLQNGEVFNCTKLEMFFSGFPKIIGMRHFPSVTVLMLVDQPIKRIEGISSLNHLRELWIAECEITKIEHLGPLKRLKKLYLYDNSISTIENIDHLLDLEVLWLNNNQISNIENMSNLKSLAQLNISENRISKIGHTLDSNISLTELNISGNAIVSLRDLTNLMRLSNLTSLSLKDPVCSPCPVSLLCNYSTHILFHLQTLTQLDTYEISRNVAEMAETTVVKKKMYYNMRVKTTKRNLTDVLSKMKIYKDRLLEMPMDRVKNLKNALKEMQMQIEEMLELNEYFEAKRLVLENCNDEGLDWEEEDRDLLITKEIEMQAQLQKLEEIPSFSRKLAALNERLRKWERRCSELEFFHREAQERLTRSCDTMVKKMVLELESGGNVRFEEGSPSDVWFTSCQDLVLSRFCATDYKEHGITGVKIHRIIRVHNRMLRTQFDEKLSLFVDDNEGEFFPGSRNMGYKKLLEYLFSMWDPTLPSGTQEPMMILEEGFADADTYKSLNRDGAVPLSNSLSLADRHRIKHLTKLERSKEFSDNCPFRYGQLIISKVYLGKSVKALDERQITGNAYPKIDAVFKPRKMCLGTENQGDTIQTCECSARQCEWYVFDNELVLPEYVVEFEYITKFKSKSPFTYFSDLLLDNRECKPPGIPFSDEEKAEDENVMKMEPQAKPRPRLVALTDVLILKAAGTESVENITVLNLHGNCLSRLKPLHTLKYLCRLTVSFNELTRLDDLANMHLEYLDASFNKISTLDGFKNMTKLKSLDLSWNKLVHTREELSILRKHVCHLICLDLRNNPWQKPENLRLRVIGRLKSLMTLDGVAVNESESTLALRVAAGSRISQLSLFTHGRVDTEKPRSLSLMSNAQILEKLSRHKPEKQGENDILWYSKVTTLNLDDQHITKLSGLERMENLRWASFNNNDITKIEGLEGCVKLEELSLENNCISKLEGISKLVHLRRLSLGSNLISSLDGSGLHSLIHLHYLSLENNNLQSMAGLQKVPGLVELYIGNNDISSVREVFYLKSLANLVILDLYGNPVATEIDNYRLFVIYHLKYLKALDGTAITVARAAVELLNRGYNSVWLEAWLEASEGGMAKDTFGGRLTPDFVAEKLGHSTFHEVRELDLPNSAIRIVDLGAGDTFINLRSVNLEHNNLTSFSGLIHLPNIRVLCLNHNHIECIMPKPKTQPKSKPTPPPPPSQSANNMSAMRSIEYLNGNNLTPIMENLEVLHLGYNGIKDLAALQLSRLTSLKALFLQGNEITKVEGIEGLHDLRELVLDRNKVKNLSEMSFANQWNMQELHLEENRIRDLSYLNCMDRLQRLYLGSNRIQEVAELQKLEGLVNLIEISLVNNPAARRHLHRPLLVFKLANLLVIDGIPVTEEERAKAELYFMDQQPVVTTQGPAVEGALPGIGQYKTQIPVKVTTMNLGSSPIWNGGVLYDDNTTEVVQRGGGRRRQGTKENGSGTGLNRANTIVYQNLQQAQGYGAFTSNGNSRPQYFLNQTPYVNPTQSEYVEWFSRINQAKNNKR